MDFNRKKLRLGDVLVNSGVITAEQLQKGLELQKGSGRKLGETLVDEGITTEENIAKALSSQLGYEMVDLQDISIDEEILNLVPPNILKKHTMIPFEYSACGNVRSHEHGCHGRYQYYYEPAGGAGRGNTAGCDAGSRPLLRTGRGKLRTRRVRKRKDEPDGGAGGYL